ncbi:MAG: hypothetical protein HQM12_18985 [SAR324 cluster bacterium]|nr:hypothetical protein [SAR324 cluster bacterium]
MATLKDRLASAKPTKLEQRAKSEEGEVKAEERLGFVAHEKPSKVLKNFRLDAHDLENLKTIATRVNEAYPYKNISENSIVRALLLEGTRIKTDKLIKYIKELV